MRGSAGGSGGFSLIEVLVALLILCTAAMALAGLFTTTAMAVRAARIETLATALAVDKIEQLRSLRWGYTGGAPVTDTTTDLSTLPAGNGGAGLRASPSGSLSHNSPGYVDYLDAAGQWAGTGPAPPRRAWFVRRWSIAPLAVDPDNVLIFEVLVTTVAREAARLGVFARPAPQDVLFTVVKARTAGPS